VSELITAIVLIAVIFVIGVAAGYLVAVLSGRKGRP
jgi:flagellin-like protein